MNFGLFFQRLSIFLIFFIPYQLYSQVSESDKNLVDFVNPLAGSDSKVVLSNGNTYPAIATPWGMNFWTQQTGKSGDGFIYQYNADKIRGFKQTHQASNWIGDYGQFAVMPGVGKIKYDEDERASWFSHKTEISKPYYYSVYLAESNVTTEITTTERAAVLRFTFPSSDSSYIVIDALDNGSFIKIIPEQNKIIGYTTKNTGSVPANFKQYFVLKFSRSFSFTSVFSGNNISSIKLEDQDNHVGAVVGFKTLRGDKVEVNVASSFISPEQAEINLLEIGNDNFEKIKNDSKAIWNQELNRIQIEYETIDQARTFYSCFYRTLLFPRKFFEIDADKKIMHYSPFNGKVLPGYLYTDNGYFDTFRALFPFFSIMYPETYSQILQGMVNAYNESGWLPEWTSPGHHTGVTFGAYSAAIISDAYLKGIRDYDINTLFGAILKNTISEPPKSISSVGRLGVSYYNKLGYVPYDVGVRENTARTIEYAYLDYTIYELAKALRRPKEEIKLFAKRSYNYKNHFDPSVGLMRGKNKNGTFQSPFDPFKWGDAFTEGNSWHYTWAPVNDMKGLINLMGGKSRFINKLDSIFVLPPIFDESWYGYVIHEMREMQVVNMGQYVHGNQPMQHVPYLFNYAGAPWKTQFWVREIMNRLYNDGPAGYCGDEDTGQTSAWYLFSALGFYPVAPGTNQYVIGAPLFRKVIMKLPDNRKIEINAPNNNANNRYVKSLKLNGKIYSRNWLNHFDLIKGAVLDFKMSDVPNKKRGVDEIDAPYSFSDEKNIYK